MRRDREHLTVVSTLRSALSARFEIDTRSLAVFRIAVALLVIADLVLRARNFELFYTEAGVVPQSLALAAPPVDVPSLYFLSTDPRLTAVLFVIHGLLACSLLAGYRTRLSTVCVAILVVSLDLRNPLVLSYADTLFMWLLCWAIFLPLGERWSVDAVHAEREPRTTVGGLPAALILLQVITVYVVNGLHKRTADQWATGEAAVVVMGLDDMTFLAADLVASLPQFVQIGGRIWYGMLLCSWLLVVFRGRPRTVLVATFVAVHLSFALTVRIGAFAFVSIAGLLLFLQASFWADIYRLAKRLADHEQLSRLSVRAERTAGRLPRGPVFGMADALRRQRRPVVGLLVGLVTVVVVISVLSTGGVIDNQAAADIETATSAVIEHQTEWSIFAPEPRSTDRQYVVAAESTTGDQWDLQLDRGLTADRPLELHTQFDTYRERFYMSSVRRDSPAGTQQLLADHYCETATVDDEPINYLTMYVITESVTVETARTPEDRERTVHELGSYSCTDASPQRVDLPAE